MNIKWTRICRSGLHRALRNSATMLIPSMTSALRAIKTMRFGEQSRFLVTQDMDFSDLRQFAPGLHCGVLFMRLHSPNRRNLTDRIIELFQRENIDQWVGCFVVATERKIRVVRPDKV